MDNPNHLITYRLVDGKPSKLVSLTTRHPYRNELAGGLALIRWR